MGRNVCDSIHASIRGNKRRFRNNSGNRPETRSKQPRRILYQKPITLEDHQNSRFIVEPLHLLDCCQESDGGQALIVTTLEKAKDLKQKPAVIAAAAQGVAKDQHMMKSYFREDITGIPEMGIVARQLWEASGLGPKNIQTATIYDHFTPLALHNSKNSDSVSEEKQKTSSKWQY